ncbi:MAG: ice-binding family protein [Acidobacteriota bacterium]|nr:ice-binding family protein [Acidobacteriota bacterium]
MRKSSGLKFAFMACLTAFSIIFSTGCGDADLNPLGPPPLITPPTVIAMTPLNGSVGVCPSLGLITATFSKPMNPTTINATTFTLAGPGGASVSGAVTYNAATNTATFTPTLPLAVTTLYTATITTGVTDTFDNHMVFPFSWSFTTPPACPPPAVIFVTPPNGSVGICPSTAIVSATFNQPMNAATINAATFTLSSPGPTAVAGTVTYNAVTHVATFTPTVPLALNTNYTATITTGAANTFGQTLPANFVWTFTTALACAPPPAPIVLGTACGFGILAGSTVTNVVSAGTNVTGDVGVWAGSAITGFPPGTLTGTLHAGDGVAMAAQGDLTVAYNAAAGMPGGAVLPADLGGVTLPAGVYTTTVAQPSLGITGNLTLDGGGDPNATWIFQILSTLTTAAGPPPPAAPASQIILINGANAHNVFWQVGSSATLGTYSIFQGTIMAQASITLTTGAVLNGRALARIGAVTLDSNQVNVPPCP